ncbi:MAG: DUF742 domain-containing protein [Acidimicrobiales bacterium]
MKRKPVRLARPFTITGGRTRSESALNIEDLVVTTAAGGARTAQLQAEQHQIANICLLPRSVAEVSALVGVPIGVTRVVIGDMVGDGLARVYGSEFADADMAVLDNVALLERLLDGLRSL